MELLLKIGAALATGMLLHVMAQPKNAAKKRKGEEYKGKVCVLGAGVAGLQVARSLKNRGIDCVVFDKAPDVGGLWRHNYVDSGIQAPKLMYEFPDFPAPYGDFAKTPEIQSYIKSFVDKFALAPLLRLNTKVESVTQGAGGKGWSVSVSSPSGAETLIFDYVVICQGMYSTTPNMEMLKDYTPGKDVFKGRVMHSSEYTDAAVAEGKQVVVVGSGKSAIDIALHASKVGAKSTLLFRNAHWGTPRLIAGLIPFKFVFTGRLGQALVSWYKGAWPSQAGSVYVAHKILWPVIAAAFRLVELIFAIQFGHFGKWRPSLDFVKDFYGYAQIHTPEYTKAITSSKVELVKSQIVSFGPDYVTIQNGKRIAADVVVFATGFGKSYGFLSPALVQQLDIDDDGLYLYRHMLPAGVKDIAFVGSESASLSNICTYGIQAEWLARMLTKRIQEPSDLLKTQEIDMFKTWKRGWMPKTGSRAGMIMAHWIHYHDSLLRDMGEPHRRFGMNWLAEIFHPYDARAYKGLVGSN